jgi:hypothetical protein
MSYLRHPKTLQEKRASIASPVPVRPKRGNHRLPDNWDDKPVSIRMDRSWKNYRLTKWK